MGLSGCCHERVARGTQGGGWVKVGWWVEEWSGEFNVAVSFTGVGGM